MTIPRNNNGFKKIKFYSPHDTLKCKKIEYIQYGPYLKIQKSEFK